MRRPLSIWIPQAAHKTDSVKDDFAHGLEVHRACSPPRRKGFVEMIATTKLRKAMHEIATRKGDFTLFALLMRAAGPGTWDLVVSAPWIEAGRLKATSEFVSLLTESIGEESLKQFSRVVTVDSNDPAVKFILDNLPVEDGELRVRSTDLFGLHIEEAIIFRAQKARNDRNGMPHKTLHPVSGGSRGRG